MPYQDTTTLPRTIHGVSIPLQYILKRVLDVAVCLALAVILWPLFIIIAVAIKLDSPGPVFFRQVRIGQYQRRFTCYKFRSMRVEQDESIHEQLIATMMSTEQANEEEYMRDYRKRNDARVTDVGRIIRKLKLDELPQIFNVLKGDMSLVGPRPAIEYELKYHDPHMLKRFQVKSGITGLWQVQSAKSVDYKKMVELDLEYVENWSLLLDLKIIGMTVPTLWRMMKKE